MILWRIPLNWVPKGLNSLRQKDKEFFLLLLLESWFGQLSFIIFKEEVS